MILTALYEYYQRKSDQLPGVGLEEKELPFLLVLAPDGSFLHVEDTREPAGKRKRGKVFRVPQAPKKAVNIVANLLWGPAEYVLATPNPAKLEGQRRQGKESRYRERLEAMHRAFIDEVDALTGAARAAVGPVACFLGSPDLARLQADPLWSEIESGANLSFRVAGAETPVCSLPEVLDSVAAREGDAASEGVCLISGRREAIRRTHPPIRGVPGAQPTGANLVSFNLDSFRSFGRVQGANAPVGMAAAACYTTALNHLLASDQCLQLGDASTVFWAERSNPMESLLAQLFGEPPPDDPDRGTRAVRELYQAPLAGSPAICDDRTRFYILGLAPNAARLAVRFWQVSSVGELAGHIRDHFRDLDIVRPRSVQRRPLSVRALLTSLAAPSSRRRDGDLDNLPPRLAGELMRAILTGAPYPQMLLQAVLRRIRAEQAKKHESRPVDHVSHPRAALIKAWLNRQARRANPNLEREIDMLLDESNTNIGYRLGRLFAVLEKIQEDASPGLNTTIRDSYFGTASSTPGAVFPTLMRRAQHHLSRLRKEKPALHTLRDKQIQAIVCAGVDGETSFPAILALADQGRFAIGYYQQRQALFSKSETQEGSSE